MGATPRRGRGFVANSFSPTITVGDTQN